MSSRFLLFVSIVSVVAVACGGQPESPAADAPARGEAADGRFGLVLELPKSTWRSDEPIDGRAALVLAGAGSVVLGGSGSGPIGFSIVEVGGTRAMEAAWQADCARHDLSAAAPIVSGITKSGGWSADDPNAAFYDAFFADPLLHLPAGTWDISAVASFSEGVDCSGPNHDMTATVRITVSD